MRCLFSFSRLQVCLTHVDPRVNARHEELRVNARHEEPELRVMHVELGLMLGTWTGQHTDTIRATGAGRV